jgi:poly [ADP-ribose] polymerase
MLERGTKTTLPKPVINLVNLLFDVESMKKTLQELEIDMDKMPLGKLSKEHLKEAMSTLTELSDILV